MKRYHINAGNYGQALVVSFQKLLTLLYTAPTFHVLNCILQSHNTYLNQSAKDSAGLRSYHKRIMRFCWIFNSGALEIRD